MQARLSSTPFWQNRILALIVVQGDRLPQGSQDHTASWFIVVVASCEGDRGLGNTLCVPVILTGAAWRATWGSWGKPKRSPQKHSCPVEDAPQTST